MAGLLPVILRLELLPRELCRALGDEFQRQRQVAAQKRAGPEEVGEILGHPAIRLVEENTWKNRLQYCVEYVLNQELVIMYSN